jgi:phytoene synthase
MRSSDFRAIADDAAKDDEAVAFLSALSLSEQAEWLTRLQWLRLADRLSENEIVEPQHRRFERFCAEWRALADRGEGSGEHASAWREMRAALYAPSGEPRERGVISAWSDYLQALGDYTRPGTELPTLREHDRMLRRLTGNAFAVFPYLRDSEREAARGLGALDQMLNNLRDLAEDASHGLCFFPRDVLARFGVKRGSLLDGSAIGTREYATMMCFWLDDHLTEVRGGAEAFIALGGLHPSLVRLRQSCLDRYARIEQVFRDVDMDYLAFPVEYWREQRPSGRQFHVA